jgi:mannose-6-phosphate isomerase-like protein (cupin superfamily)
MIRSLLVLLSTLMLLFPFTSQAQELPSATDVTAIDIDAFIDALPKDSISDRAIRVVDVGGYNIGIFGVFRPQTLPGRPIRHQTSVTEIYYIVSGTGTLVTGGVIEQEESTGNSRLTGRPNFAGSGISGGVSRQVVPGDVIVIPGNTPHWFSSLDTDIRYLIFRPDPERLLPEQ